MTAAWNNLYDPDVSILPTTHLYVKLPCCLTDNTGCDDVPCRDFGDPPCVPGNPDWPDCLKDDTGGGAIVLNDCGCAVPANIRNPAGCIQVEDTQLGMMGVKSVKVITMNGLFSIHRTFTDENGCFKIDKNYSGKGWVWVRFTNEFATIRPLLNWSKIKYLFPVTDYAGSLTLPFNNIHIVYKQNANPLSSMSVFWNAATVHNAILDYREFAETDGLTLPPANMTVVLSDAAFGASGAAPMLGSTAGGDPNYILSYLFNGYNPDNILSVVSLYLPDLWLTYTPDRPSDRISETVYHESGHASHFRQVNSSWWSDIRTHAIFNLGYGTIPFNSIGSFPDKIALAEAWGFFIGPVYADRKYGLNFTGPTRFKYLNILEGGKGLDCNPDLAVFEECDFRFVNGFIPRGLILDLIDDNNNDYSSPGAFEDLNVTDDVSGFTIPGIFQHYHSALGSLLQLKALLEPDLQTSQTIIDLDNLFENYEPL